MKPIYHSSLLFAGILLLAFSCSESPAPETQAEPVQQVMADASSQVMHPVAMLNNKPVSCQGYVDAPPQARFSVRVPVAGLVKSVKPLPGQRVKQGELIAQLSHPDYIHLQQQYLEAKSEYEFQAASLARQTELRGQGATTEREYTRAVADQKIGQARLAGMAAELRLLGIDPDKLTPDNLSSVISIYSPKTAYVTSVSVSVGEMAGPDQEICQLVMLEHLHVEAAVYEQDRHKLRIGQQVTFHVAGNEEQYRGKILLIGRQVSADNRSVQVHIEPDDEEGLIPGAYVTAELEAEADSVWLIPDDVVINGPQGPEVHVATGNGQVVVVPISGARRSADGLILAELPPSLTADSQLMVPEEE